MTSRSREIIDFIGLAEKLKQELRHSWLSNGRQESVAEHVFSMSLLAMLLFHEIETKVDQLKVLKMIIVHDLVEIYARDITAFEVNTRESRALKDKNEKKALKKLISRISSIRAKKEIEELWEEFQANKTPEAKLAQACDKADAVIQHNNASISTFEQGDYDINPYYKHQLFDFDPFIRELKNQIDIDTMNKIEKEGDIKRVDKAYQKKWDKQKSTLNITKK